MKKAIIAVFACAAIAMILRLLGVLGETTLVPATLLGLAMILMLLKVVAESDREY